MKKFLSAMISTGLLLGMIGTASSADNVTIIFKSDNASSTFNILDNSSNVVFRVTGSGEVNIEDNLSVEDNLSAKGISGPGKLAIETVTSSYTINVGESPVAVDTTDDNIIIILPCATNGTDGLIYSVYNYDRNQNTGSHTVTVKDGNATRKTLDPGMKTECMDVGYSFMCF